MHSFSRALRQLHVTSSFDWFTGFSVSFVILLELLLWVWFYSTQLKTAVFISTVRKYTAIFSTMATKLTIHTLKHVIKNEIKIPNESGIVMKLFANCWNKRPRGLNADAFLKLQWFSSVSIRRTSPVNEIKWKWWMIFSTERKDKTSLRLLWFIFDSD